MSNYAIGVDFGTGSGRVAIVNVDNGDVAATHVTEYKHGVITDCLPNSSIALKRESALQHPKDYLTVLETSIPICLQEGGVKKEDIVGIGIDFTACTILPITSSLEPLCFDDKWKNEPHAWVKLWKHHAAQNQADRINRLAIEQEASWLARYGGIVSSEWMLPKLVEVIEEAPDVYEEAAYFMEASDWITSILTGKVSRNNCAAGFKGLWHKEEGYIGKEFLKQIHPSLENVYETKLAGEVKSIGQVAGYLTTSMAERIGLNEGVPVAMGIIDAHAGVPGATVASPGELVLVMGTSTCHMLLGEKEELVPGISGVVKDGIIPGYYAYEAGQAAVGDIFAWFVQENVPAYVVEAAKNEQKDIHQWLEEKANKIPPGSNGLMALDWHNGCRTPLVNSNLSGMFVGLTLNSKPEEMYRSLIEATAYGTKLIIEQFEENNIKINSLVACGGLPQKNKLMMQIYADVTGRKIQIASNTITPAIGSAMYGAVVAGENDGGHATIQQAAKKMGKLKDEIVIPKEEASRKYQELYSIYKEMVYHFGKTSNIMHKLKEI
ncbi:ribulokinase [Virgibacillus halodenitrificans]|uniref:ribulokinase n=1 Tax=Virgibacillus halodenitrificans TaxID=1482 RepID=UPI0024C0A16F|nr:ribulokinase [Virgibacillus halodenitrificans]WHX26122.1 ribulokinase [Virgibacillus halodenitrificans]